MQLQAEKVPKIHGNCSRASLLKKVASWKNAQSSINNFAFNKIAGCKNSKGSRTNNYVGVSFKGKLQGVGATSTSICR